MKGVCLADTKADEMADRNVSVKSYFENSV